MLPFKSLVLICLAFGSVAVKAATTVGVNDTGDDDDGFDLSDAFGPELDVPDIPKDGGKVMPDIDLDFGDQDPKAPPSPPVVEKPKTSDDELDLGDAINGKDKFTPTKKPRVPIRGGGNSGSDFDDKDLLNGDYKPDQTNSEVRTTLSSEDIHWCWSTAAPWVHYALQYLADLLLPMLDGTHDGSAGRKASGGSADNNGNNAGGQSAGTMAGIVGGIAMALVGAAGGYFTYQKKKLCFKIQGNTAEQGTKQENVQNQKDDPQSYSTLLQSQSAGGN